MKTKEYGERGLLIHLRKYHLECDTNLLPITIRERATVFLTRHRERPTKL